MKGIKLVLAAALLGVSLSATAQTPPIDLAHEIEARAITLPKDATGTVVVQGCKSCPTLRFQATANTTYQVGQFVVGLQDLRVALAARPNDVVLLLLSQDRRAVEKIAMVDATH
jgi:hypothetical protein